jgi:hypothetical protein
MRTPGADGVVDSPAPQQRRERTKSVVWKDAPHPKGTPKSTPKPELSTVVTYAREPGTNARKVVCDAHLTDERSLAYRSD